MFPVDVVAGPVGVLITSSLGQHTSWKINGWNLQPSPIWKGNWSEPNLQGIMFHVNLQECKYDAPWKELVAVQHQQVILSATPVFKNKTYIYIYLTNKSYADDFDVHQLIIGCATGKLPVAHVQKLLRINGRHWVKKPPKANCGVGGESRSWLISCD